jgi:hypothetical protein
LIYGIEMVNASSTPFEMICLPAAVPIGAVESDNRPPRPTACSAKLCSSRCLDVPECSALLVVQSASSIERKDCRTIEPADPRAGNMPPNDCELPIAIFAGITPLPDAFHTPHQGEPKWPTRAKKFFRFAVALASTSLPAHTAHAGVRGAIFSEVSFADGRLEKRYCQMLWIGIFQAAATWGLIPSMN